jgi:hypothetical protein
MNVKHNISKHENFKTIIAGKAWKHGKSLNMRGGGDTVAK